MRTLTPPDPPLQDDVVLLRPPEPADADALLPIRSEEDTRRWMLWDDEPPPDHAEILANIERARQSWADGTWAVFVITVDGEVVGGANLGFYDHDIAEGSYFLARRRAREGLCDAGAAAARALGLRAERDRAARAARRPAERGVDPARRAGRVHARGNPARVTPRDRRVAVRLGGVLLLRASRRVGEIWAVSRTRRAAVAHVLGRARIPDTTASCVRATSPRRAPTTRNIPPNPPSRASGS